MYYGFYVNAMLQHQQREEVPIYTQMIKITKHPKMVQKNIVYLKPET